MSGLEKRPGLKFFALPAAAQQPQAAAMLSPTTRQMARNKELLRRQHVAAHLGTAAVHSATVDLHGVSLEAVAAALPARLEAKYYVNHEVLKLLANVSWELNVAQKHFASTNGGVGGSAGLPKRWGHFNLVSKLRDRDSPDQTEEQIAEVIEASWHQEVDDGEVVEDHGAMRRMGMSFRHAALAAAKWDGGNDNEAARHHRMQSDWREMARMRRMMSEDNDQANILMRKAEVLELKKGVAASFIQRKWRAHRARRREAMRRILNLTSQEHLAAELRLNQLRRMEAELADKNRRVADALSILSTDAEGEYTGEAAWRTSNMWNRPPTPPPVKTQVQIGLLPLSGVTPEGQPIGSPEARASAAFKRMHDQASKVRRQYATWTPEDPGYYSDEYAVTGEEGSDYFEGDGRFAPEATSQSSSSEPEPEPVVPQFSSVLTRKPTAISPAAVAAAVAAALAEADAAAAKAAAAAEAAEAEEEEDADDEDEEEDDFGEEGEERPWLGAEAPSPTDSKGTSKAGSKPGTPSAPPGTLARHLVRSETVAAVAAAGAAAAFAFFALGAAADGVPVGELPPASTFSAAASAAVRIAFSHGPEAAEAAALCTLTIAGTAADAAAAAASAMRGAIYAAEQQEKDEEHYAAAAAAELAAANAPPSGDEGFTGDEGTGSDAAGSGKLPRGADPNDSGTDASDSRAGTPNSSKRGMSRLKGKLSAGEKRARRRRKARIPSPSGYGMEALGLTKDGKFVAPIPRPPASTPVPDPPVVVVPAADAEDDLASQQKLGRSPSMACLGPGARTLSTHAMSPEPLRLPTPAKGRRKRRPSPTPAPPATSSGYGALGPPPPPPTKPLTKKQLRAQRRAVAGMAPPGWGLSPINSPTTGLHRASMDYYDQDGPLNLPWSAPSSPSVAGVGGGKNGISRWGVGNETLDLVNAALPSPLSLQPRPHSRALRPAVDLEWYQRQGASKRDQLSRLGHWEHADDEQYEFTAHGWQPRSGLEDDLEALLWPVSTGLHQLSLERQQRMLMQRRSYQGHRMAPSRPPSLVDYQELEEVMDEVELHRWCSPPRPPSPSRDAAPRVVPLTSALLVNAVDIGGGLFTSLHTNKLSPRLANEMNPAPIFPCLTTHRLGGPVPSTPPVSLRPLSAGPHFPSGPALIVAPSTMHAPPVLPPAPTLSRQPHASTLMLQLHSPNAAPGGGSGSGGPPQHRGGARSTTPSGSSDRAHMWGARGGALRSHVPPRPARTATTTSTTSVTSSATPSSNGMPPPHMSPPQPPPPASLLQPPPSRGGAGDAPSAVTFAILHPEPISPAAPALLAAASTSALHAPSRNIAWGAGATSLSGSRFPDAHSVVATAWNDADDTEVGLPMAAAPWSRPALPHGNEAFVPDSPGTHGPGNHRFNMMHYDESDHMLLRASTAPYVPSTRSSSAFYDMMPLTHSPSAFYDMMPGSSPGFREPRAPSRSSQVFAASLTQLQMTHSAEMSGFVKARVNSPAGAHSGTGGRSSVSSPVLPLYQPPTTLMRALKHIPNISGTPLSPTNTSPSGGLHARNCRSPSVMGSLSSPGVSPLLPSLTPPSTTAMWPSDVELRMRRR